MGSGDRVVWRAAPLVGRDCVFDGFHVLMANHHHFFLSWLTKTCLRWPGNPGAGSNESAPAEKCCRISVWVSLVWLWSTDYCCA